MGSHAHEPEGAGFPGSVSLSKEPPAAPAAPAGPAWIVVPARVVALVVLVPLRLVHDLAVLAGAS